MKALPGLTLGRKSTTRLEAHTTHSTHSTHATGSTACRLGLVHLDDAHLARREQRRNTRGINQRRPHDLEGVDDSGWIMSTYSPLLVS